MSAEIEANRNKEPLGVSDAYFAYRRAAMILRDLEEIDDARNSQFGDLHERVVGLEGSCAALREEFDAYKEEVCELRSALDSERLGRASMEWKLDNLSEDFADLVEGLEEAGVTVSDRCQCGEALAGASSVVAQNFNERKEAGNE